MDRYIVWYFYEWDDWYEAMNWESNNNNERLKKCINQWKKWLVKILSKNERFELMNLEDKKFQEKVWKLF